MPGKQVTYIELTPEEFSAILKEQRREIVSELSQRIGSLTDALSHQAPSFTREQAAAYCDRSLSWIDARRKEGLPCKTVGGHPRFLRTDLDHLLCGGTFDQTPERQAERSDLAESGGPARVTKSKPNPKP